MKEACPSTFPLFAEPSDFDRERIAAKLRELAAQDIYIGGSSWKYEGWLGQIYTYDRYLSRGRFSKKKFEQECLAEYAETFPIVCGDFAFYQFPTEEFWRKLFGGAPPPLKFGFKVPEEITVRRFPNHPRYGDKAGLDNPDLPQQRTVRGELPAPPRAVPRPGRGAHLRIRPAFAGGLSRAADVLRRSRGVSRAAAARLSLLGRGPQPGVPAARVLRDAARLGVAHVFNGWTRMPPIPAQIAIPEAFTAPFVVARALLRTGRPYERAVEAFSPYTKVQDENPETRTALRDLIERVKQRKIPAYLFVNNRLEGNAPMTIQAVVD